MIEFLFRRFTKGQNLTPPQIRQKYGMICGAYGIFWNIILFACKLFAGILSGAISIIADAFNNLSDASSSLLTLVGFRLAGKKPDIDHPFGHGRYEYISGMIVAMLIVFMGFELMTSSVKKIFQPEPVEATIVTIIILAVSIVIKLYMLLYNRRIGKKIDSSTLQAAATDSLSDSVSTCVVLICLLIYRFFGVNLDAWCGVLVSLFILYAGISSAKSIISQLLGKSPESDLVEKIVKIVREHQKILGIHDLIVHDYGPGNRVVSLHAEVSADEDILAIHDLIDNIEEELHEEIGCLAVIHMDPIVINDEVLAIRDQVAQKMLSLHPDTCIHDFRMVPGVSHSNLVFDVVVPFAIDADDEAIKKQVNALVEEINPTYHAVVKIDRPFMQSAPEIH